MVRCPRRHVCRQSRALRRALQPRRRRHLHGGAEGTYRIGWAATYADWKTQAQKSLGGEVHGEEVHVIVEGTMATATHLTEGTVKTADGKTIDQRVRETSVFRKEDGGWKMIGHQADNYPVWIDVVDR